MRLRQAIGQQIEALTPSRVRVTTSFPSDHGSTPFAANLVIGIDNVFTKNEVASTKNEWFSRASTARRR
jgi:hypothetical protein